MGSAPISDQQFYPVPCHASSATHTRVNIGNLISAACHKINQSTFVKLVNGLGGSSRIRFVYVTARNEGEGMGRAGGGGGGGCLVC